MRILRLNLADAETVAGCYEVLQNAAQADDPLGSPVSAAAFRSRLSLGLAGGRREIWFAPGDGDGSVAGWYDAEFPGQENLDRTGIQLVVDPARRRGGLGSALLRHAAGRAAADGRAVLHGMIQVGSAGEAFALRFGAALGQVDIRRVQELAKLPPGSVAQLRESTAGAARGYSLVRWVGITPDERIEQVAALLNALNDAPNDPGVEPTIWDAARVRDQMNARIANSPFRRYSLAALHDENADMAALTVVSVDPDVPGWGHQRITVVTRPHRGHRLGLLVKAAMLDWLAETESRLQYIETWNAGANDHMIAINESLGYRVQGQFRSAELEAASIALP